MHRRTFMKWAGAVTVLASGPLGLCRRILSPLSALAKSATFRAEKVICLGLDGMDPVLLRRFLGEGLLPNFAKVIERGDFKAFGTSIPPQSPVAWSNFITGQDAGGHGIFDFIHRVPETLLPQLSISEAKQPSGFWKLGKWKFPKKGGGVELLRHGRAFWEDLAEAGIDTTVFKVPSNFPPVPCRARTISGMGTPDILGTYGIFSYYTDQPPQDIDVGGGRIIPIAFESHSFTSEILGPVNSYREGDPESAVAFRVTVDTVHPVVQFELPDARFILRQGEWSDWLTLHYDMLPHVKSVTGICRFYLMEVRPAFRLYVSPVQIDPANPEMPICTPEDYAKELAQRTGLFYTQGLPDDTKALDEGVFQDVDYVSQADLVLAERMRQYRYELDRFRGLERGFLFFYFNSLDQNCHMFWRSMDPDSPRFADSDDRFADRIRNLYIAMDRVLEQALSAVDERTVLFAISDHGFAPFHRCFHVNTWLWENGYLTLKPGVDRKDVAYLSGIDWRRSRAYALGINGLYVNLRGREGGGIVSPGSERETLVKELVARLEAVVDAQTGQAAIRHAYRSDRVYHGPYAGSGPDIVLGYRRGYRGSNESALGKLPETVFADNLLKWSGDHCMAADEVPGIIVCNHPLAVDDPSLLDMAPTFLSLFGLPPGSPLSGRALLSGAGST
jgi:predicted AlkP superfamily phosphohydrolase/phosphomutase